MHIKRKRKKLTESHIQQSFFQWLAYQYPEVYDVTAAIPNAGKRSPANAARMKREGMKAGVPDVAIFHPTNRYHGMFIEFKSAKGKLTDNQMEMMENLAQQDYYCIVCRSLEDAIKETRRYLNDSTYSA